MTTLKNNIMKRVKVIYMLRTTALPLLVSLIGITTVFSTVSVVNVIKNAPSMANVPSLFSFFVAAFGHTEFTVKAGIVLSLLFGVYTIYRLVTALNFELRNPHCG